MKLFSIYFSTMTFLLIELIGLIKGEPVEGILLKSVGAFLVLFFLGNALSKYFGSAKKVEADPQGQEAAAALPMAGAPKDAAPIPAPEQALVTTDAQTEMYKQEAIQLARTKPKEVAKMFEALIDK